MTQHTARDEIWNLALRQVTDGKTVTPAFLADKTGGSERTARDVLATMRDYGWLTENERYSHPNDYEAGDRLPKNLTSYE